MTHTKWSVLTFLAFCGTVTVTYFTKSNITFVIGVVAGGLSIYSSIISIREKYKNRKNRK